MTIKPLHDQVLVKQAKEKEKTEGGLYIPTTAQEKSLEGEVLACGGGRVLENGTVLEMSVKPGDVIMFPRGSFIEVKIDNEDYLIIREENILAVVNR